MLLPAATLHVSPLHTLQSLYSAHTGASIYAQGTNGNVCHPQSCRCCWSSGVSTVLDVVPRCLPESPVMGYPSD